MEIIYSPLYTLMMSLQWWRNVAVNFYVFLKIISEHFRLLPFTWNVSLLKYREINYCNKKKTTEKRIRSGRKNKGDNRGPTNSQASRQTDVGFATLRYVARKRAALCNSLNAVILKHKCDSLKSLTSAHSPTLSRLSVSSCLCSSFVWVRDVTSSSPDGWVLVGLCCCCCVLAGTRLLAVCGRRHSPRGAPPSPSPSNSATMRRASTKRTF